MALLSELVSVCEKYDVDSGPSLSVFSRRLREAGRVSKAGRGRGAAHMTFLDAARFLIACAATDHPERAAEAEQQFSAAVLIGRGLLSSEAKELPDLPHSSIGMTFDLAVSELLRAISSGAIKHDPEAEALSPQLIVSRGSITAQIWVPHSLKGVSKMVEYNFVHPNLRSMLLAKTDEDRTRLKNIMEREVIPIRRGKNLRATLDFDLLKATAVLIGGSAAS